MDKTKNLKSGEFLVKEVDANDIFVPEEYNEEQLMIAQTCKDFIEAEVYPHLDKLDKGDRELMKEILKKAGELGLMGISIPEEYGGFGQSFVTQMLTAETIGCCLFIFCGIYGALWHWHPAHYVLRK
jgi:alkylation response protein AidB-like acyl-CoA dehydrogenase